MRRCSRRNGLVRRRNAHATCAKLISMGANHLDPAMLQAALIGYEVQRKSIESKIAEIRKQLGARATAKSIATTPKNLRRKGAMSAAARKRIAAAQKKRWAAYRKAKTGK